ncbi:MAG: hypothetical protein JWP79_1236 [Polaromonas sp.]|jgi:uncharacterized protein (DUF1810 family)|nr:hypothetical protein [Polaromonas sp.]MDB5843926.1 hypothetical protein [Polaromonas sp.]
MIGFYKSRAIMNSIPTPQHGLERFIAAQDPVYPSVCEELAAGRKTSHWMWFVFPQLKALGRSSIAKHFGIETRDEALAYWQHPVLARRLRECTALVLAVTGKTAHEIFGSPDDLKFRSCMTLFAQVAPDEMVFSLALQRFFGGQPDENTLNLLKAASQVPMQR